MLVRQLKTFMNLQKAKDVAFQELFAENLYFYLTILAR